MDEEVAVKPAETKAAAAVSGDDKPPEVSPRKLSGGSIDRDIALAEVEKVKRNSFIKAWEESEKSKAENKAQKKLAEVASWENSQNAAIEAKLKKMEEDIEQKKVEYAEKMKNKIGVVHKQAEEKKAMVEAQRKELLHVKEDARLLLMELRIDWVHLKAYNHINVTSSELQNNR